jgi:hypothetical protein
MGPGPVDITNWEALYKEENRKAIALQKSLEGTFSLSSLFFNP